MAKRISSRQFVTVFVSLILSFGVKAADLTIGYQTGIDPSKVPQADGLYDVYFCHQRFKQIDLRVM